MASKAWQRLREFAHGPMITEANSIVRWLAICYMVDRYVFHLSMTHGPSMLPTLNEMGDVVVVDKLSPRFAWWRPIKRGDIVVADSSYRKDFTVCKRVIALEGDTVHTPGRDRPTVVPRGHVWLEGDNPQNSVDSRTYGPVPEALIRGRVAVRVWPLTALQWMGPPGSTPARPASNSQYLAAMLEDEEIVAHAKSDVQRQAERAERERQRRARREQQAAAEDALRFPTEPSTVVVRAVPPALALPPAWGPEEWEAMLAQHAAGMGMGMGQEEQQQVQAVAGRPAVEQELPRSVEEEDAPPTTIPHVLHEHQDAGHVHRRLQAGAEQEDVGSNVVYAERVPAAAASAARQDEQLR